MSAFGGKADIIQEKADIKKCPLMTQSGHRRDYIKKYPGKKPSFYGAQSYDAANLIASDGCDQG
jgi:hypothetical protein